MEWSPKINLYPRYWHSRLKRGFGLGSGSTYHPWLRVRDVPSRGTSGNPKGILISRQYHLLSTQERVYFFLLERESNIVDIREQFPILHLNATLQLCGELGVRHQRKGAHPEPFTIDFLITRQTPSGLIHEARSVKTPADAQDPKIQRRLMVEYRWCQHYSIDWKLIASENFTPEVLSTLTFERGWSRQGFTPDARASDTFAAVFLSIYRPNLTLRELVEACSRALKLGYSQCLNQFRYCAWSGRIAVDPLSRLAINLPVTLKK
jgi:hypothetical protein